MFSYRCPSCGKQHAAEKEPEATFTTKCLRCGWVIDVPGRGKGAAKADAQAEGEGPEEANKPQRLKQAITTRRASKREKGTGEDEAEAGTLPRAPGRLDYADTEGEEAGPRPK